MYSIDKIKLYIYGIKLPAIENIINKFSIDNMVIGYESHKITSCRYNYTIQSNSINLFDMKIPVGTVYLGIEPNWSKDKNRGFRDLIIEYNPNKVRLSEVPQMNFMRWINVDKIEIKSMDIALDLLQDINSLVVHKRHGNEYKAQIEHNALETIYLGAFGTNGHIKIYNKAKEQKINDGMKWTRFEITYKNLGFMDIRDIEVIEKTKLPNIYLVDHGAFEDLKDTEKYIMLTSMQNIDLINMLGRKMKVKVKEYHSRYLQQLDINLDEMIKVYRDFKIIEEVNIDDK